MSRCAYRALALGAMGGDFTTAKAALEDGADANGPLGQPCLAPIVTATIFNHAHIVDLLLEHGADPDTPVTETVPHSNSRTFTATPGERPLHIAVRSGRVDVIRALLPDQGGARAADPNAVDGKGCTPLVAACQCDHSSHVAEAVVRLLLEAGADPAVAQEKGYNALHFVAMAGRPIDLALVDLIHARAPATLNLCADNGATPLYVACGVGHEGMASKLLSLGALQLAPGDKVGAFPLVSAASAGSVGVVRLLIKGGGGLGAVGGEMALAEALCGAIRFRRAAALRLLLVAVDGENRRSKWANINVDGMCLVHRAAGFCCPAVVRVLLEAGANETARDDDGRLPRDTVGLLCLGGDDLPMPRKQNAEVAIRRMLERCPAYRARSWAWPRVDDEEEKQETDAGGQGDDGDDAAAAAAAAAAPGATLSSPLALRLIWHKKTNDTRRLFMRNVDRYCSKD